MSYFRVMLPEIPDAVQIHTIYDSPLLKRAKNLLIAVAIAGIILTTLVVAVALFGMGYVFVAVLLVVLLLFILACLAFAIFYLSKLSMRKLAFRLFRDRLILSICASLMFQTNLEILNFLAAIIAIYVYVLDWRIARELSFICHDKCFFLGYKLLVFGFVLFMLFLVLGLATANTISMILSYAMMIAIVASIIAGLVICIAGVFRLKAVIEYGESAINPIKHF